MNGELNLETPLELGGRLVEAVHVQHAKDFPVRGRTIVVNLHPTLAQLGPPPRGFLPALSSTILVDTTVEQAESLLLVRVPNESGIARITDEAGWSTFGALLPPDAASDFPRDTPLWRGPQFELGTVDFDPAAMLGEPATDVRGFQVKVNLWFAPAETDCVIHNRHDFLEIHTQICGFGRMQKFSANEHRSLYEDVLMRQGNTHQPFCVTAREGFAYPWHQYRSDSDCVWLAVEYHSLGRTEE